MVPNSHNVHLTHTDATAFTMTWIHDRGNFILHSQCSNSDVCEMTHLVWFPANPMHVSKTHFFSHVNFALDYVKNFLKK
jgi:hypothetical protein